MKIVSKIEEAVDFVSTKAVENIPVVASLKENKRYNNLDKEIEAIETELASLYKDIGEQYVETIKQDEDLANFNVDETVKSIELLLSEKLTLEEQLVEKEIKEKEKKLNKEKAKSQKLFDDEKAKLDKALLLEVINQDEYNEKLQVAQKKLDNFHDVFRLREQLAMELITKEEYEEKINSIVNK